MSHARPHSYHPAEFAVVFTAWDSLIPTGPLWERGTVVPKFSAAAMVGKTISGKFFLNLRIHDSHLTPQSSFFDHLTSFEIDLATHTCIPLMKWYVGLFDSTSVFILLFVSLRGMCYSLSKVLAVKSIIPEPSSITL